MMDTIVIIILLVIVAVSLVRWSSQAGNHRGAQPGRGAGARAPEAPVNVQPSAAGIQETGPMIYFANDRHHSVDREYQFNYRKVGSTWRAYILKMPNLGGRSSGIPHRLSDHRGSYICWSGSVNNLKDIQNISRAWADNAQEYMVTGKQF